ESRGRQQGGGLFRRCGKEPEQLLDPIAAPPGLDGAQFRGVDLVEPSAMILSWVGHGDLRRRRKMIDQTLGNADGEGRLHRTSHPSECYREPRIIVKLRF